MNKKVLTTLEYNKITNMLADMAGSAAGKEMCLNLVPHSSSDEALSAQVNTGDALSRIYKHSALSFSGLTDVTDLITRLNVGATLGMGELLVIARLLNCVAAAIAYNTKNEDEEPDSLTEIFENLVPLTTLKNDINRCIISEDTMSDDASSELKSIRREIKLANSRIHDRLQSIINSQSNKDALQDSIITMRNNRYCVPVKAEYRSRIPGMIHDQSQTGSTLFVEPQDIVNLNNEISSLVAKEHAEIERILAVLSNSAALAGSDIENNYRLMIRLDFIFAKGNLAKSMNASKPLINNEGIINLKSARHPLIDSKKVVPVDIRLGEDFTMLVITGPNTGGKTVSLKTTGLLTLMGLAGLHIPAFDGSSISVFDEIYADIGDEQSIEQSLSTFSSHMVNTVNILDHATDKSLVLFDELGQGTDPVEGAALAASILSFLHEKNIRTVATTHYSEIKLFALDTAGIENACAEFDVETLSPTYRLLIGVPGKSNAFSISSKLGLSSDIIEDAKKRIDINDKHFEDVITELENSRHKIEEERKLLNTLIEDNNKLKEKLALQQDKLNERKEKIIEEANEQARKILDDTKEYADKTLRTFHKLEKDADVSDAIRKMENERNAIHGKMKKSAKKNATPKPSKIHKPDEFHLGDTVKVVSMNTRGTVLSLPDGKGNLYVQMGILRTNVNINDLELIDEVVITGPGITKTGGGKIKMSKSLNVSTELKLIGMTVDEALSALDKYLDDAYLAHLPEVTIIHGRGTGALKNAVAGKLKRTKYVSEFHVDERNYGATIVKFK